MSDDFLKSSQKRAIVEETYGSELFFSGYLSYSYPDDYPKDYVLSVEENKIHIASLDRFKCSIFKSINTERRYPPK